MRELIFLVGIPASGKSTIAQKYYEKGYKILSSDRMRIELFGDVNNQDNNTKLFSTLYSQAREELLNGENVVIDATNISSKKRIGGIKTILNNTRRDKRQLNREDVKVIAEIVACPYNECIDRNKMRDRKIPNGVIENMYQSWQTPIIQEGFDEVILTYTSSTMLDVNKDIEFLKTIPQFNKNHKLTIGDHCEKVANELLFTFVKHSVSLFCAGLLHDFGKMFCMQFKDSYGKPTQTAHFYNHEFVSAYDSFYYFRDGSLSNSDRIRTSQLITWHMISHRLETEKSIEKYKKFFGEDFWNDLMLLHEADKNGRE